MLLISCKAARVVWITRIVISDTMSWAMGLHRMHATADIIMHSIFMYINHNVIIHWGTYLIYRLVIMWLSWLTTSTVQYRNVSSCENSLFYPFIWTCRSDYGTLRDQEQQVCMHFRIHLSVTVVVMSNIAETWYPKGVWAKSRECKPRMRWIEWKSR